MTTSTVQITVPASCVHAHGQFDANRDWPCERAAQVHMLAVWAQNIDATAKRADRARGHRVGQLRRYVADETYRMRQHMDRHPLPTCTLEVS